MAKIQSNHFYLKFTKLFLSSLTGCLITLTMVVENADGQIPNDSGPSPDTEDTIPETTPPPTLGPLDAPQGYSPPQYDSDNSRQFNLYRLDTGDSVSVNVRQFPEFSFSGLIDPEGFIRVPFLGKLPLAGLTLEEVESKISYELGQQFLREEPEVIASFSGFRAADVTVLGEVVRPGYYQFTPGTPLTAIIQQVGGSTPRADLRSIIIRRKLVDGTVLEESVDIYSPLVAGGKLPDFRLQGGDAIIVSKLQAGQDRGYDRVFISRTSLTQPTIVVRVIAPTNPIGISLRNLTLNNGSTYLDALSALPAEIPLITKEEVTLMRFDPEQGKIITQTLNRIKAVENQDIAQFMPLQDNDVIIISRTIYGKILQGFRIITQPIRDIFGFNSFIFGIANSIDRFNRNNN